MSRKTHIIQIRATEDQFKRIRNFATAKGFTSVSAYLRNNALRNSLVLEQQVADMHKLICGKEPKDMKQYKKKPIELDYGIPDEYDQAPTYGGL